jgi:hypothetical protein
VLADGSDGGNAVVRATGPDDLFDFVNASSVVEMAGFMFPAAQDDRDLPVEVQTDYVLSPGADAVRMETTITNTGASALDIFLGDYMNGSGQVDLFQPGYGFGEPLVTTPCPAVTFAPCSAGTCDLCNFVAYAGKEHAAGVSYGYVHSANGSSSFSVSGVTREPPRKPGPPRSDRSGDAQLPHRARGRPRRCDHRRSPLRPRRRERRGDRERPERVAGRRDRHARRHGHERRRARRRHGRRGDRADATWTALGQRRRPLPDRRGRPLSRNAPARHVHGARQQAGPTDRYAGSGDGHHRRERRDDAGLRAARAGLPRAHGRGRGRRSGAGEGAARRLRPEPRSNVDAGHRRRRAERDRIFSGEIGDPLPFGITGVWFADKEGRIGRVDVEPGTYRVYVSRGPRYSLYQQDVTITAGATTTVAATIARVVDTPGFIAADFHLHSLDSPDAQVTRTERVATQLAEGIDFFTPSDHDIRVDFEPTIEAMGVGNLIATAPSAEITTFDYGHFNSWPVTVDPSQVNGGSVDWGRPGIAPGMDFPSLGSFGFTPGEIYDAAHADPRPNLIQINHIDSFFNATGLDIDTAENDTGPPKSHVSAASRRLDPAVENFFDDGFDALEVWNGSQPIFLGQNIGDWFNMLNYGILRTGVADSDTHERRTNGGAVRTWVASAVTDPAALAPEADTLAANIVAGRGIGTNSLFFTPTVTAASTSSVAGLALGQPTLVATTDGTVEVKVEIRAPLWAEFDRVELYVNGATQRWDHDDNPATRLRYRVVPDVTLDAGTDFTITTVDGTTAVPDSGHREATITYPLTGLTGDVWIVVLVRGTPGVSRPLFPLLPGIASGSNTTLADLTDGNLGEGGETVLAFSNPLYVDVDGAGWSAPGVRLTPP